jgi:hypothetical protein
MTPVLNLPRSYSHKTNRNLLNLPLLPLPLANVAVLEAEAEEGEEVEVAHLLFRKR